MIERLRARGLAVVYISHFLEEVRRVASSVHRPSRRPDGGLRGSLADSTLAVDHRELMVGRDLTELFPRVDREWPGEVVLDLIEPDRADGSQSERATLTLQRGEVLGIGGLVGAGRTELLRIRSLVWDAIRSGQIRVRMASRFEAWTPSDDKLDAGVGLLSEDRKSRRACRWIAVGRGKPDLPGTWPGTLGSAGSTAEARADRSGFAVDGAASGSRRSRPVAGDRVPLGGQPAEGCSCPAACIRKPTSCSWMSRPEESTLDRRPRSTGLIGEQAAAPAARS